MNADAKRPGVKNWQNLADIFYGWPLTVPHENFMAAQEALNSKIRIS